MSLAAPSPPDAPPAWRAEARRQGLALAAACERGDAAAAADLLARHARVAVDARFGALRRTPLAWACGAAGAVATAEALAHRLVLRRADLDARDAAGEGPLAAACRARAAPLALVLLERGAQPNGVARGDGPEAEAAEAATLSAAAANPVAAAPPALPEGWSAHEDGQGRTFYAHQESGSVQWERPAATNTKGWEVHLDTLGRAFFFNKARGETTWDMPLELVPPAWERHEDKASGRAYFHDAVRGLTAWEQPADFVESDPHELAAAAEEAAIEAAFAPFTAPPPLVPPLVLAIDAGLGDVAARLVELGADVASAGAGAGGRTPLLAALEVSDARLAHLLLDRGAPAHPSVVAGRPLLVAACAAPALDAVALRLLDLGCDANVVAAGEGTTPLIAACAAGSARLARRLLSLGANANQAAGRAPHFGASALSLAFSAGLVETVGELLEAGATDVNCVDLLGRSLLQFATAELANEVLVRRLLARGAKPNAPAASEHPAPLLSAIKNGLTDAALALVHAGADLSAVDEIGLRPLGLAAGEGNERACVALIDAGAAIDATDAHGYSALVRAILKDRVRICLLLLERGADFSIFPHARTRAEGAESVIVLSQQHARRASAMGAVADRMVYLRRAGRCVVA